MVQESYVLPFSVKALGLTQTQHHITGKNLVVLTQNNLVYQIDSALFTARRPHGENLVLSGGEELKKAEGQGSLLQSNDFKNKELPPYDAVIPINPIKYLSYGQNLMDLRVIKAFPTRLESTS